MTIRKFTERRFCSVCGRPFTVDLMKRGASNIRICSQKCRRDSDTQHKQEYLARKRITVSVPDVDIHRLGHAERVEYYARRYAAGLDPLTGRRLSRTLKRQYIAFDIRIHASEQRQG